MTFRRVMVYQAWLYFNDKKKQRKPVYNKRNWDWTVENRIPLNYNHVSASLRGRLALR
jgi:hypothetical protein